MEVNGIIEKVEENMAKNGTKYLVLSIDGNKYGVWDNKLFDVCGAGHYVTGEYEQKGQYKNIVKIERISESDVPQGTPAPVENREERMVRMNAINNSTQMLICLKDLEKLGGRSAEELLQIQIALADKYISYIKTGKLPTIAEEIGGTK